MTAGSPSVSFVMPNCTGLEYCSPANVAYARTGMVITLLPGTAGIAVTVITPVSTSLDTLTPSGASTSILSNPSRRVPYHMLTTVVHGSPFSTLP